MEKLEITYVPLSEIQPYSNNPRKNDKAVDVVAKSIKEFGFRVPIILDKNNVIIAGHTRLKAAIKLGLNEVPVIWADDLTEEQVKAFRIMDNKSSEYAEWDDNLLKEELNDLKESGMDLELTGFSKEELKLKNIDDLIDVQNRAIVITVNPPEAPRLKEKESFNFKTIEEYEEVRKYFLKDGNLDTTKLINLIK